MYSHHIQIQLNFLLECKKWQDSNLTHRPVLHLIIKNDAEPASCT